MPWLGIGLVVLALLAVILVLTRNRVTIVAPPASTSPSPVTAPSTGTGGLIGNAASPPSGQADSRHRLSAQVRVTTTLGKATGGTSADASALLAKMGLPGGLVEQAKASLHRAEAACPRYPDSTLVFSSVNLSRSGDPIRDRQGEADRLVLACAADPEQVRRWYGDWLTGHGWQIEATTPAAGETAADLYVRGSEQLRLTLLDRALLSLPQGVIPPPEGQTIYQVRYVPGAP
jgi:hypothetical protein